ncbi:MAG: hypothetical protein ABT20_11020 [Rubrivivax sp. SCN 70-15]|nr:MAG: hypothetical protein ABT20_11020 [Rubrivivax sp. SCN 70-15]
MPRLSRDGFHQRTVDEYTITLDLDQPRAEPAFPDVAQHASDAQRQVGLGTRPSAREDLGEQWGVHDRLDAQTTPLGGSAVKSSRAWSEPEPDTAQPGGRAIGLGSIVLAQ